LSSGECRCVLKINLIINSPIIREFICKIYDIKLLHIVQNNRAIKTDQLSRVGAVIGAIGGASPKPGNGEGCVRKGIQRKILASALHFY
jgi:hypothetical protein